MHFGKQHGKKTCIYVIACVGYLVVPVNHNKLDFANLTQMWLKILICNEFTFNVSQYLFSMFCFHPASTISTQHPLPCREIYSQHPDPFHPASRRKIWLSYLSFWCMPWLHISHFAVNLQFMSLYQIKTTESESTAADWHAMNRHFSCSAMMDAGWNSTQHYCLRGDDSISQVKAALANLCTCHVQAIIQKLCISYGDSH